MCRPITPKHAVGLVSCRKSWFSNPFFNVREALRIQSGYFGVRSTTTTRIDEPLAHLGPTDKAEANRRQLSGGMKRRVLAAQALVHKPPVIVLDEPDVPVVDVELRQTLWQIHRQAQQGGPHGFADHPLSGERPRHSCRADCDAQEWPHGGTRTSTSDSAARRRRAMCCVSRLDGAVAASSWRRRARVTGTRCAAARPQDAHRRSSVTWPPRGKPGLVAEDVEMRKADLEDVFIDIMNRHSPSQSAVGGNAIPAATSVAAASP